MMRTTSALLFLLMTATGTKAQSPFLEMAPIEILQSSWYAADAEVGGFTIGARRSVPLFLFLPNVSEDSRFDLLDVSVGARSANRDFSLAWSVKPLDAFIAKSPWAGGLTLLSYDRTGPLRVEADWLAVRAGPALRTAGRSTWIDARLLFEAAVATVANTGALFRGSGDASTGVEGSAHLQIHIRLGEAVLAKGRAVAAALAGGDNPMRQRWSAGVDLRPDEVLSIQLSGGQLRVEDDRYAAATEWLLSATIRVSPRRQTF